MCRRFLSCAPSFASPAIRVGWGESLQATPVRRLGQFALRTITYYDRSLRAWRVQQPDNTSVINEFYATGLLKKNYGSCVYPVEYTYGRAGRVDTMKTWTNYPTGGSA